VLGSDGAGGDLLILPAGGSAMPTTPQTVDERLHTLRMEGRQVFRFATRIMPEAARQVLGKVGLDVDEVRLFVPHQANDRILKLAARALGASEDRMFSNLARYGNTSAASIPIALCEAIEQGWVERNDLIVLVGFGAGLTWAAAALRWSLPLPVAVPSRRMTVWRGSRYRWARMRSWIRRVWWRLDAQVFQLFYEPDGRRKKRGKK
jgi:3-oxoacyl-[acyl-carrier-protein] synthase-3